MSFLLKAISTLMSVITAAITALGIPLGDSMEGHEFPVIGIEQKADDAIRVMSFNVRCTDVGGNPAINRRLIVLEEILKAAPDSLGLQEATPQWMTWLGTLEDYGIVGEGRDGGKLGEHCPVLYNKTKYKLIDSDTFWLSETPDKVSFGWDAACRRVCTWALLENINTGLRYVHVNSHFDNAGIKAVPEEAKQIAKFIKDKFSNIPVVFTADMNTQRDSEAYRIMTAQLSDARETAPDCKSFGTYHDAKPEEHTDDIIDYILYSESVTPLIYRTVTDGIDGRFVSDHFPIYADVKIEQK
ncbi:MAG: endonuclease/exonuclease/phosphatase family protein [Clostridia bacterium]|nr:endonuclease/exonuclease/phosphatase family protein [Clostridia bacterium]